MRSSSTLVLLFAAAVIQALPIPQYYGGAPVPAVPQPPANGYDVGLPPVDPYQNEVPPYTGTEVPPPAESTEVPPPAGTEVPPPAESTEVPPPAGTEVPPPAESTEVPPPAGTEVPPPTESTEVPPPAGTEVPPPAESTEVPPPAGTEVPPPAESTEVPPPADTEVPYPVESTEVPPPVESEVPPPVESQVPPYEGEVPPTETGVPPTTTDVPPTETEVPPTSTEVPPSATEVPPSETQVPPGNTELPTGPVYSTPGYSNYRPPKPTEIECRVSKTGFEPKVMSVKKGDTIKFRVSAGGKFGIRHGGGGDASPCVPLEAGTETTEGEDQTLSYTVPEDASDKIYFYNVEGDKCTKTDMSATLNVGSNLVADSTAPTAGNSTTDGESNARSNLPTLVLAGALSFVASIVQI